MKIIKKQNRAFSNLLCAESAFTMSVGWQLGMSMEVFLWQPWNEGWWTVLLGYVTVSKMLAEIKQLAAEIILFFFRKTAHHCTQHSQTAAAKTLSFIAPELSPPIQCWNPLITRFIVQHEHKWVNKIEKTRSYWQKSWKAVILHLSENMLFLCLYFTR